MFYTQFGGAYMKDIYDNNGKVIATVVDHYQIQKDLQEQFERSERERGGGGWNPSFVPGALAFLSIPAIFVIPFFLLLVQGFTFCGFGLIITIIQHFPIFADLVFFSKKKGRS